MFADETPQLKSPVDGYFTLAKRKLDLSKTRSKVGKKGGDTARIPVSTEQVNATQPFGLKSIGMDGFLRNNPQVRNDVYKNSMRLAEGINWSYLDEMQPTSAYSNCKSLYQILTNYNEIIKG